LVQNVPKRRDITGGREFFSEGFHFETGGTAMKTRSDIYEQHSRIFRKAMRNMKAAAKRAHPETDGCQLLVHNWGNDAAREVVRLGWDRTNRIRSIYRRLYDEAEHRTHGPHFRPLWCRFCGDEK